MHWITIIRILRNYIEKEDRVRYIYNRAQKAGYLTGHQDPFKTAPMRLHQIYPLCSLLAIVVAGCRQQSMVDWTAWCVAGCVKTARCIGNIVKDNRGKVDKQ